MIIKEDFFEKISKEKNINFTDSQKQGILETDGKLLLLAIAGSGKTTTLEGRLAYLMRDRGVSSNNILNLTFSRASAVDMSDRFVKYFGDWNLGAPRFATIHGFANSVLKAHSRKTGTPYTLITSKESKINKDFLMAKIYKNLTGETEAEDSKEQIKSAITFVKNLMINEEDYEKYPFYETLPFFKDFYKIYESEKRKNNVIDFDDMLTICYEILQSDAQMLDVLRGKYKYIHVDEAQDTSKIQHEIIKLLSKGNNLMMVGDDDQSIYGFRGAYPAFLLNFKDVYPEGKTLYMEENFRSTKKIVSLANFFIKKNVNRYEKNMKTPNEDGEDIKIKEFATLQEQAEYVMEEATKGKHLKDYAIIFRNNLSSIIFADMFDKKGIPFYMKDEKLAFFKNKVTEDILAFLKLSLDPSDFASFKRIAYKLNSYISAKVFAQVEDIHKKQGGNVFKILRNISDYPFFAKEKLIEKEDIILNLKNKKPKDAITDIEYILGYREYIEKKGKEIGYSLDSAKVILLNLRLIADGISSLEKFIQRLDELKVVMENAQNTTCDAIVLTTAHSSKGLQYKTVFVVDLNDDVFPGTDSISASRSGDNALLEEERRLAYVAITRAEKELVLCYVKSRGGDKATKSRFIKEIEMILYPEKVIELKKKKESVNKKVFNQQYIPNAVTDESLLKEGVRINHASLGIGVIDEIDEGLARVIFEKGGLKTISLEVCLDNELISIAEESDKIV